MQKTECFKIRLTMLNKGEDWLAEDILTNNPLLIIDCDHDGGLDPIMIVADPFLFVHHNELYLFYEEKSYFGHGVLKMIKTDDLERWSKPEMVLKEPFHLSYPFVFEDNGKVYMIPETSAVGEVRLYQAQNDDLTKFAQIDTLLRQDCKDESIKIGYSDSSVYKHDGKYFLMTTINDSGINTMKLYVADNLTGPYKEHPLSPICKSQKYGRNAGSVIERDGVLYRFVQDCEKRYGDNVHVFEITKMDDTSYSEKLVKEYLYDVAIPFYKEGGHQLNIVDFAGKQIIATDAKEYILYLFTRIIHKVKNLI